MNVQKNTKGFTIIEVVLVLAIAGLIFLMVFIALPALQRNQRDTARKQEISTILAQVTSYQSNNRGNSPAASVATKIAFAKYLEGTADAAGLITLNSGTQVMFGTAPTASSVPSSASEDVMVVVIGAKCDTSSTATSGAVVAGTKRQAAAVMKMENADAAYCQTN